MNTTTNGGVNWVKDTTNGVVSYTTPDTGYENYKIVRSSDNRRVFTLLLSGQQILEGTLTQCREHAENNPVKVTRPNTGPTARGSGNHKYSVGGYSVASVLRWCGSRGWSVNEARQLMADLQITDVSDCTVKTQIYAGRKGEAGGHCKVPNIDETLVVQLNKLRKSA